jgi:hypothetical protein
VSLPRLNFDLADGEILDVGLEHYGEFLVNRKFADELMAGGMRTVDGRSGRLQVVDQYENALQLRWVFDVAPLERALPQLRRVA